MGFIVLHNKQNNNPIFIRPESISAIEAAYFGEGTFVYTPLERVLHVKEGLNEVVTLCLMGDGCSKEEAERAIKCGLGEE